MADFVKAVSILDTFPKKTRTQKDILVAQTFILFSAVNCLKLRAATATGAMNT